MRSTRLLWRIYLCFFAATLAALAVTTWHAARSLRVFHRDRVGEGLTVRALLIARDVEGLLAAGDGEEAARYCGEVGPMIGTRITVVRTEGTVMGDSDEDEARMENHADRPEIQAALQGRTGRSVRFSDTLRRTMMYVAVPVRREGDVIGAVRTSLPLAKIEWDLHVGTRQILTGGVLAGALFALAALYLSRRITRPLEEIQRTAARFAQGDLTARLALPQADEIGEVARTFNDMAAQLGERLETILRQQSEMEGVLGSMVEGVLAVDREERVLHMNAAAARLLDVEAEQVRGRSVQEAVRNCELQAFVATTLAAPGISEAEVVVRGRDERTLQLHGTTLRGSDGESIGGLVVLNDITRLKRLETMRRDFVANVSHELKTPITALKGCAETLAGEPPPDPGTTARFVGMLARHVGRVEAIVEDLLSLSRLEFDVERGDVPLHPGPVRDVLQRAARSFAKQAQARKISLDVECSGDCTATLNPALLEQAVGNLIDNAVKYGEADSRVVIAAASDDGEVRIRVSDEGPGIERKHLPRLFERFYRVDQARSRALGGTGLGLAIVKHIALAHHGSVSVESEPGKGSTFTIVIPRR